MKSNTYNKHIFISLLILLPIVGFGYFAMDGVFGDTKIGITLKTNPDLEEGLIGHWSFDATDVNIGDLTAEVKDRSPNAHHGDWRYHATNTVPGAIGQAISFDGNNDDVEVGYTTDHDLTGGDSTISTWFKTSEDITGSGVYLIDRYNESGYGMYFINSGTIPDEIRFQFGASVENAIASSTSWVLGEWNHAVAVTDTTNSEVRLYINGELVDSDSYSGSLQNRDEPLNFANVEDNNRPFKGAMDDVRMYDRALSASEIRRLYELGATTKVGTNVRSNTSLENNLLAHWTFDGDTVDRSNNTGEILDASGNFASAGDWLDHATTTVPGAIGSALYFDGVDDAIEWSDGPFDQMEVDGFSAFAWLNVEDTTGSNQVAFERDVQSIRLQVNSSGNAVSCAMQSDEPQGYNTPTFSIRQGEWYHAGCVFSTTTKALTLYVNGASSTSVAAPNFGQFFSSDGAIFQIGKQYNETNYFYGAIDDVRLYDRELSSQEVERLYGLGATTKFGTTLATNPDLESGLLAHWTFDSTDVNISDLTSEIKDRTTNANHGNWLDHATTTVPGILGQAIAFDASDDFMSFQDLSAWDLSSTDSTLSAWFYIPNGDFVTADGGAILERSSFTGGYYLGFENSGASRDWLVFRHYAATENGHATTSAWTPGEWQHVAAVTDTSNTEVLLYVNGELVVTDTYTGTLQNRSEPLTIGDDESDHNNTLIGSIDDVRMYNRALSAEEIKRLYELAQ